MRRFLSILLLAALFPAAGTVGAEPVSGERPAEYMIYQYEDTALVVKIDVPEAEFISTIHGPDDALVSAAGIPQERIGPLFQYIPPHDIPRQLMIKVKPSRAIDRSRINLELIQLSGRDRMSEVSAQAYQLMSQGSSLAHSNDTSTWAVKAYTLRNAAQAFAELGWEEMRLWGDFYAAHLALVRLNDVAMAMDFSREIQSRAKRAGFLEIELAAAILEAEALQAAGSKQSGRIAAARLEQAHTALERVASLAGRLGLRAEQARALFNNGLVYQRQDMQDAAVGQFQSALDVSLQSDDLDLVNEIRGTAAALYESQGVTSGAIEMLEDIGSDLESDSGQQLTDTLFEKGRILNSTYRYPEAAAELARTLELQKADPADTQWGPTGLALAWSLYSMGDREGAAAMIEESLPRTPVRANTGALLRAYDSMATLYRAQQQYPLMALYRGKQGDLSNTDRERAHFLFESGRDAWKRDGSGSREAREQLEQGRRLAAGAGDELLAQRAAMSLCLLRLESGGSGACSLAQVRAGRDSLRASGVPRLAAEAGLLGAWILYREGRHAEARSEVRSLMQEVMFYRQTLPGVLGAWYWNNRTDLLGAYVDITLAQSGADGGREVLLALDHVRRINALDASAAPPVPDQHEGVRSMLARRDAAEPAAAEPLAREATDAVGALRRAFRPSITPMAAASLDELLAGLDRDESVLTFYFSGTSGLALVGTNRGVTRVRLSGGGRAGTRLAALRGRLPGESASALPELDDLGRALLGPLSGRLTTRIYLLPFGPLTGFPFDLLRTGGEFLAAGHEVVNLASLSSLENRRPKLPPDFSQRVFLAGNPQQEQDLFSYELSLSAEIASLTDRFVGPGLQIVQGVALRKDEFQEPLFRRAGLIHLSTPGSIDLERPERSTLEMSRTAGSGPADDLSAAEIGLLEIDAGLVVLSRTAVKGSTRSGTDSRLGLVSDFLDAGAASVIASTWSVSDAESAAFADALYGNIGADGDVAQALLRTRRAGLEAAEAANFESWARFQLHIR